MEEALRSEKQTSAVKKMWERESIILSAVTTMMHLTRGHDFLTVLYLFSVKRLVINDNHWTSSLRCSRVHLVF